MSCLIGGSDQVIASVRGEVELNQILGSDEQFTGSGGAELGCGMNGGGSLDEDRKRDVVRQVEMQSQS
jgi:hypothetical protein